MISQAAVVAHVTSRITCAQKPSRSFTGAQSQQV